LMGEGFGAADPDLWVRARRLKSTHYDPTRGAGLVTAPP
jgi:hypothetical protein